MCPAAVAVAGGRRFGDARRSGHAARTYAKGGRGRSWARAGEWTAEMQKLHEVATNLVAIGLTKQGFTLELHNAQQNQCKIALNANNQPIRPSVRSRGTRRAVSPTTASAAEPPSTTACTAPRSRAATPDSKAPSSFDEPMKMEFTGGDAPEHLRGRQHLDERGPDDDAHVIGHSAQRKEREREAEVARQAEADDAQSANTATARACVRPARRNGRTVREEDPHRDGARGRRGAQQPQALRPDVQDLGREHRQQRLRAAEEDGEEVERQRAEDRGLVPARSAARRAARRTSTCRRRSAAAGV